MNTPDVRHSVAAARSGRSVLGSLSTPVLSSWRSDLHGRVLDLASGDGTPQLRRLTSDARWIGLDIAHRPDVVADATRSLPLRASSFDAAVVSWFLYIAREPCAVLSEVRRVLRPGGVLILSVPLVFPVNPEPTDLWRFTDGGIDRLLSDAGFAERRIVPLGGRWSSAAYLLEPFLRPRSIVMPAALRAAIALDRWTERRVPEMAPNPVGYCVRAVA
ncbi:MAG: class I SAM-dependent methyltransferase [Actinomycetota bacterium]